MTGNRNVWSAALPQATEKAELKSDEFATLRSPECCPGGNGWNEVSRMNCPNQLGRMTRVLFGSIGLSYDDAHCVFDFLDVASQRDAASF